MTTTELQGLDNLFQRSRKTSPFYQKLYRRFKSDHHIDSREAFQNLGFISLPDLKRNFPFGLTTVGKEEVRSIWEVPDLESLTAGRSSRVAALLTEGDHSADLGCRTLGEFAFSKGDLVFNALAHFQPLAAFQWHQVANLSGATTVDGAVGSGESYWLKMADLLTRIGPSVILCHSPLILSTVLSLVGSKEEALKNLRAVVVVGKPQSPGGMKKISQMFMGKPVYQSWEIPEIGQLTLMTQGNILEVPQDFHIEVINPKTLEPVPTPGMGGEVVITSLQREGLTLVRYRTGDLGKLTPGTMGPRLEYLGSLADLVEIPETGGRIPLPTLEDLLYQEPGTTGLYKVEVKTSGALGCEVDYNGPDPKEAGERLRNNFYQNLGVVVELEVRSLGDSCRDILASSTATTDFRKVNFTNIKNFLVTY